MVSDKQEASPQPPIFIAVNALINFPSGHFLIDWQSATCDRHLEDRYSSNTLSITLISWWVHVRHWVFISNTDNLIIPPSDMSQHLQSDGELCWGLRFQGGMCLRCPFRDNR